MQPDRTFRATTVTWYSSATCLLVAAALTACSGGGGGGGGGGGDPSPTATADSYLVAQPLGTLNVSSPGVLVNDVGNSLSAALTNNPSCGNLSLNPDGSFTYTQITTSGTCATADSFTYRANNGSGSSTPATVTLAINQPPVANNGCAYYPDLTQNPLPGTLGATDPEGQSLTYSIVPGSSAKGNATLTDPIAGAFVYTPNLNSRGADTFTFEVTDENNVTSQGTFKIVHIPRIMPLGDSITEGIDDAESPGCGGPTFCPQPGNRVSYRKDLRDALVAAGYTINFVGTQQASGANLFSEDPEHEGHGGWTADHLVNGNSNPTPGTGSNAAQGGFLSNWLNGKRDTNTALDPTNAGWPDVILLHIGTNDLSPGGNQSGLWTNVESIRDVITNWSASNNWPVTVIYSRIANSNPPVVEFTAFNDNVINMLTPTIWVDHEAALNAPGFYGDSVHPNSNGYSAMANVWLFPLAGIGTPSGNHTGVGILPKCP